MGMFGRFREKVTQHLELSGVFPTLILTDLTDSGSGSSWKLQGYQQ